MDHPTGAKPPHTDNPVTIIAKRISPKAQGLVASPAITLAERHLRKLDFYFPGASEAQIIDEDGDGRAYVKFETLTIRAARPTTHVTTRRALAAIDHVEDFAAGRVSKCAYRMGALGGDLRYPANLMPDTWRPSRQLWDGEKTAHRVGVEIIDIIRIRVLAAQDGRDPDEAVRAARELHLDEQRRKAEAGE